MAMSLPTYPAQSELAPVAWAAAFNSLILEVTDEPGHYIDLAKLIDADDSPDVGHLLLLFPAPAFQSDHPGDRGDGPHGIVLTGESRDLALKYLRFRAQMTRELLLSLPE